MGTERPAGRGGIEVFTGGDLYVPRIEKYSRPRNTDGVDQDINKLEELLAGASKSAIRALQLLRPSLLLSHFSQTESIFDK